MVRKVANGNLFRFVNVFYVLVGNIIFLEEVRECDDIIFLVINSSLHNQKSKPQRQMDFPSMIEVEEDFWFNRNSPFLNDSAARVRVSTPSWSMYKLLGAAYLNLPDLNDGGFLLWMSTHHSQCLKTLRSHTGEGSSTKQWKIYVPPSLSELYRPRTNNTVATLSTSSSSLPPLTSESSSLSNKLWYPHTILQSPQEVPYTPYINNHSKMSRCSQPQAFRVPEVVLEQGDGPSFTQDYACDEEQLYFASHSGSSSLADWRGGNFCTTSNIPYLVMEKTREW
ncbi:hypothetical protein DEU56DRAFT_758153 [Suillus clintonianus]|uniref:uncharacterized protein n=1 Tax=Suillus clintonianus TaxID=1904413 RepID=UPI001B876012|nr:uncharacterized protein DEU56DRAFT_758153 [Suillus clintonianus]KAG2129455.1 hypothetical protein DEU56DRAFT_758153 [Suillus clintonianus]